MHKKISCLIIIAMAAVCGIVGVVTAGAVTHTGVMEDEASILPQENQPAESEIPIEAIISLYRVADIYPGSGSSSPGYLAVYNGALYFNANGNDGAGFELWKYTPAGGAQRVADVYPGAYSSSPYYMTVYDGALYFNANGNDGAGFELWKYTPAGGAQRVADIYPGAGWSDPGFLTVYDGALYFNANGNDGAGFELWKYTPAIGAQRVADVYPGAYSSYPCYMTVYNGALYFGADGNDGAGRELWKYDPAIGAQRVADILPGAGGSQPSFLTVYDSALYFSADGNDGAGIELWKYDAISGAMRVADIYPGIGWSQPVYLTVYNGALYFGAYGPDGAGNELWKYAPAIGASRVADICAGGSYPYYMTVYNGALYFRADGNDGAGSELWLYSNSETAVVPSIAGQDGWVLESGETTNKGGTLNAGSTTFNLGDNAQNKQYRSVLSFDTSILPDAAVITSATLKIRRNSIIGTNPFATHGNILVDIRNGPFGGKTNLQVTDFQAVPSKGCIAAIKNKPTSSNWYSTKLMSTAYPYINRKGVTQVRLRFTTDDNNDRGADYLKFFSGNTAILSDRPVLQVTYYVP